MSAHAVRTVTIARPGATSSGPAFRRLWVAANRFAHSQVISVLNGNSTLVASADGTVVLGPGPARIPLFPEAALAGPHRAYRILTTVTAIALVIHRWHSPARCQHRRAAVGLCSR